MTARDVIRELWAFRNTVMLICTPILLLPLPLGIGTKEAKCGYVVCLMAIYWMLELLPLAVTAMIPIILYPLLGIINAKTTASQYLQDLNLLFVGGLIVAVAVERVNLHKRIAMRVLLLVGTKPRWLMLGVMCTTFFLSMWISNTAATAMMLPIVQAVVAQLIKLEHTRKREAEEHRKHPQPHGDHIRPHGMQGSHGKQESHGKAGEFHETYRVLSIDNPAFEHTEPDAVAIVTNNADNSYVTDADPESHLDDEFEPTEDDIRLTKGMMICIAYSASIGGTGTLTGTPPNLVMSLVAEKYDNPEADVTFASWFMFGAPVALIMLLLAWLCMQLLFLGWRTFLCCSRRKDDDGYVDTESATDIIRQAYNKLGPLSFAEIEVLVCFVLLVILWFSRSPKFVDGWGSLFKYNGKEFPSDATSAILIGVILFMLPSEKPNFLCCRGEGDTSSAGPKPAILDWKALQVKLPWDVVFLMGGGFALAKGVQQSGLSAWVAAGLDQLSGLPNWVVVLVVCILIASITEVASNTATANIMLPLMPSLAITMNVHPMFLLYPATIAASFSFMLPAATPPNAVVFASGVLKVSDMARAGIFMNILGVLVVTLMVNTYGVYVFNWGPLPDWAAAGLAGYGAAKSACVCEAPTTMTMASLNDTLLGASLNDTFF